MSERRVSPQHEVDSPRACCPIHQPAAGFTLLEVIVAMTIVAMMSVAIGGAIRLGVTAWEKGEERIESTQRMRIVSELILRDLRSAYPYLTQIERRWTMAFVGERDSVSFVSYAPSPISDEPYIGLREVTYWVGRDFDTDHRGLLMREAVISPENPFEEERGRVMLLDPGVREISFEYLFYDERHFERLGLSAPGKWVESWSGVIDEEQVEGLQQGDLESQISRFARRSLPQAVRMQMVLEPENEDEEPIELPAVIIPVFGGITTVTWPSMEESE